MTHQPAPPFAHYSGSRSPSIVFVGEAWGESEAECGRPFAGHSGRELFLMIGEGMEASQTAEWHAARRLFHFGLGWIGARDRWLAAEGFGMTNVLAFRPPDNKIEALCVGKKDLPNEYSLPQIDQGRYLVPQYLGELARLRDELHECRPNLVVALGNVACWALLGTRGISGLRGTTSVERLTGLGLKVLPTYHPAAVLRQWPWRQIVVGDLMKAGREAAFAEVRRPSRIGQINPFMEQITERIEWLVVGRRPCAVDIETAKGQITMVGIAWSASEFIVIPIRNFAAGPTGLHVWSADDEVGVWLAIRRFLASQCPKIFQNGLYDIQYFMAMGLRIRNAQHDTMLLHHAILPEMKKGLGFLGSVYTQEPAWKLMRRKRADEPEKADE
jgi:uracil-DNA glycosylase